MLIYQLTFWNFLIFYDRLEESQLEIELVRFEYPILPFHYSLQVLKDKYVSDYSLSVDMLRYDLMLQEDGNESTHNPRLIDLV